MTSASERRIQNEIRNALAGRGLVFRANVGVAWVGNVEQIDRDTVLIRNARRFDTGLPRGFADLFGVRPVIVNPADVGQTFGRFVAIEVKGPNGRVEPHQKLFLDAIAREGGLSGVARSIDDALGIIGVR